MNVYEPSTVGPHTTATIHHRSHSEGGDKDKTHKIEENTNKDNLIQSEDEVEDGVSTFQLTSTRVEWI